MIKPRKMRWAGQVALMGENVKAYRMFAGKSDGKRQLGTPKHRRDDNIVPYLRHARAVEPRRSVGAAIA
jgi:hypothetical protein